MANATTAKLKEAPLGEHRRPAECTHPGVFLEEELITRDITQTDAARLLGWNRVNLTRTLGGHHRITARLAVRLERVLGLASAEMWLNLQMQHDLYLARKDEDDRQAKLKVKAPRVR